MTHAAPAPSASPARSVGRLTVYRVRAVAEIKAFLRQKESMVFTLLFPVILLVLFGAIFGDAEDIAPGTPFINYFVAGMVGAGLLASSFQNLAIQIPIERDAGLLKRLRGTPMPKSAYFVGKVAMVFFIAVVEVVLLLLVGVLLFDVSLPADGTRWLVFLGIVLVGVSACTLLGIAFSSVPRNGSSAPALVTPIALVLQFISGVFITLPNLPAWLRDVGAFFPLKWICQGIRYAFLPDVAEKAEPGGSWAIGTVFLVLLAWGVVGLALCTLTFRWRSRSDG